MDMGAAMNEYELEALPEYEYEEEWESELEGEYEQEYEEEWEGESESELEGEYEQEYEEEWEGEFEAESEAEAEAFFGRLASLAQRAVRSPALRRVGLAAARSALGGLSQA